MKNRTWILVFVVICMASCTKNVCETKDFKWIFYDKNDAKQGRWAGSLYKYLIWVKNDSVFIQSKSSEKCHILNNKGEVIGIGPFQDKFSESSLKQISYSLNHWQDEVILTDSTIISDVKLISYPLEKTSLLSKRLPKRERRLEYKLRSQNYYIKLPISSSTRAVYDICQYDATRIILSIRGEIDEIKYNQPQHYVVMLDLEDFTHKYFLGIKLW